MSTALAVAPQPIAAHERLYRLARPYIQQYSDRTVNPKSTRGRMTPEGLDYQATRAVEVVEHLQSRGAMLLQDPTGTGKTLIALVAARLLLDAPPHLGGHCVDRVLVIAPNQTVAGLWQERAITAGFAKSDIKLQLSGTLRWPAKPRLLISTRASMPKPLPLAARTRLLVIVDEAHRGLGAPDGGFFTDTALVAADGRVILVTATPFQLDASAFAQMLDVATYLAELRVSDPINRRAIVEYTETLVDILQVLHDLSDANDDPKLQKALSAAQDREASARPRMEAALAGHVMSAYDRSRVGLPEPSQIHIPQKSIVNPGDWSFFFHVARLVPELTEDAQASDSFLRMLASSHEAFQTTKAYTRFRESHPTSPLLAAIEARMGSGPLRHPKVAATAEWVTRRLEEGRHVLVFCVYLKTQAALRDAIAELAGIESSASAPDSAAEAKRIYDARFCREPGNWSRPLALVVRDNLSEAIDLDGGNPCVVHHDLSWNPARFDQRMGRITRAPNFRIPAASDVFIPVLDLGLDNRLYETVKSRAKLSDHVLLALPPGLISDGLGDEI